MTRQATTPTDAQIEALLGRRSRDADPGLLTDIVRSVEATPQRRAWLQWSHSTSAQLAAILVLLALLGAALAVIAVLNREPAPPALRTNGAIVIVDPTKDVLTGYSPAGIVAPSLPTEAITGLTAAAFSPDGGELAYSDSEGLHLLEVATGERRLLNRWCPLCAVAWDPSGTGRLVLQARAGRADLIVLDVESGKRFSVPDTDDAAFPTWSPDGQRLLFEAERDSLVTIRTDGTERTVVAGPDGGRFWSPAWSPDGRTIAYIAFAFAEHGLGHSHWQLSVMAIAPEGGSPRLLAELGDCSGHPTTPNCAFSEMEPAGLAWSPDGSRLAMIAPPPSIWGEFRLMIIDTDGSGLELLEELSGSGRPAWQPLS